MEFGDAGHGQLVLVGHGDPFGPVDEEGNGSQGPDEPYFIWPDTLADDWELVEASDEERARLRDAGFRV